MSRSMKKGLSTFLALFNFQPELRFHLGVEEEYLIVRNKKPVPEAERVLLGLANASFTYELSACQIEHRTSPAPTPQAASEAYLRGREQLQAVLAGMGLASRARAVAPRDMPLDVYPDERYYAIAHSLGVDKLRAACRVMGTHVHVGIGSADEALVVYNALVSNMPALLGMCGARNTERLGLYRVVQPECNPPQYSSLQDWHAQAIRDGFVDNPRNCWHLVRISRHGTVEVRLFPATGDARKIQQWADVVQNIARRALSA